jgi:hypothetical protein
LDRWLRKGNEQTDLDDFCTFSKMSIALAFVVKSIEKKNIWSDMKNAVFSHLLGD